MPLVDGRKVVATAATREPLTSSGRAFWSLVLQAETDNTGVVVVGGSTVVAAQATRRGIALNAGDIVTITRAEDGPDMDLSLVYLDVTVSGDGVTYAAGVAS